MAVRLPAVDSDDPKLPAVVIAASIGTTVDTFASGAAAASAQATADSAQATADSAASVASAAADLAANSAAATSPFPLLFPQAAGIGLLPTNSTNDRLIVDIGLGYYWTLENRSATVGSATIRSLHSDHVRIALDSVHNTLTTDDSYTGTWTDPTNASAWLGAYRQSTVEGSTAEWDAPIGSVALGIRCPTNGNGGFALVEIDGDPTAANLLPTAQDIIDAGLATSSILTGSGGFFAATDRVIDFYTSQTLWDEMIAIVDGLDPTVQHTVTVTHSAEKQTVALASRTFIAGYAWTDGTTRVDTTDAKLGFVATLFSSPSVYEYAYEYAPLAGGTRAFYGNTHGHDHQQSITYALDGNAPFTPVVGTTYSGEELVVTRVSKLRHPDLGSGATDVADITTVYRLNGDQLTITTTTEWLVDSVVESAYVGMFPRDKRFDTGTLVGYPTDIDLSATDDGFVGHKAAPGVVMWESGSTGKYGSMILVPDVATSLENHAKSLPFGTVVQTRAALNKAYMTRVGDGTQLVLVPAGTTWNSSVRYCVSRTGKDGAADTAFSAA